MNNRRIEIDKLKFAVLQGVVAFAFAFCVPWLVGDDFPLQLRLVFATFGALFFAGFALIPAYLLACTLDGDCVENVLSRFGHGRVDLNTAKVSRFPSPVLFLLIDEKTHKRVLLPRPFWSNDPKLMTDILKRVEGAA